ncbi:MAG TPA: S53 family peptidase [Polyangiaceae bacterium]
MMLERFRSYVRPRAPRVFQLALLTSLAAVAACSSPGGESSVSSASNDGLVAAPAQKPTWANASNFQGRIDADAAFSAQVHLQMHDLAGARAELAAISDPDNALYGRTLSDDDFARKYGPTEDDVAAVRAHLEASGLRVTEVPDNRAYIRVEGKASQIEHAFSTTLGRYSVKGELRHAPMTDVKLPAAVNAKVSAVMGLTAHKMKPQMIRAADLHAVVHPNDVAPNTCSSFFGQIKDTTDPALTGYPQLSYVNCGYKPAQVREAYGLTTTVRKGNDGKGQKIAIVDAFTAPTLVQDAQTYFANEDADYPLKDSQITLYQGPGTAQPVDTGWYGEQSLDVESVHAIAPGAKIAYVGAQSAYDTDLIAAVNMIITKKLATVVSNSYGGVEAESYGVYTAWESLAIQAGLKGIGLYFATGDAGDSAFEVGFPSPNFPASLTEVTGVGGTTLALGRTGEKLFELGWEDGYYYLTPGTTDGDASTPPTWNLGGFGYGGGGGLSQVYLQPSYQAGIVPASVAADPSSGAIERALPDISMLADPTTGYLVGMTDPSSNEYGEGAIGGTSLATPLFSAMVALAQQNAGRAFGSANTLFYKASKKGAFTDILPAASPEGAILPPQPAIGQPAIALIYDYRGSDNTLVTGKGFDNATGLGVPNAAKFFAQVK